MGTIFTKKIDKLFRKNDWIWEKEYESISSDFFNDKENNEKFLIEKLKEYSIEEWIEYRLQYYAVSWFIKHIWEKYNYTNSELISILKRGLNYILSEDNLERYSYTLEVLFAINKSDDRFYISQYEDLLESNKMYHDINSVFQEIFKILKINDKFINTFKQSIINNATEFYWFDVKDGFEYLVNLVEDDFKKYFLELLNYFNLIENKNKLIHFHEYTSLIRSFDKKDFSKLKKELLKKISNVNFNDDEIKTIKKFLIWDIIFSVKKHDKNLLDNTFLNLIFQYFYKKDEHFLIEILPEINTRYLLFSVEDFIVEYLNIKNIEHFINLFKWTENENIIYLIYDEFKTLWKKDFIDVFEESSFKKEIKKRNKQKFLYRKKNEEKHNKEIEKEKQNFFNMLKPWKWKYYPKLFQDYAHYIRDKKELESIFNEEEIKIINKSVKKQIATYLGILNIPNYSDAKVSRILTFEKKQENSYSHTRNSVYLWRILDISKKINFSLDNYYNLYVLFYPLLWWEERTKDSLEIISGNLKTEDIDYILRVYSEDLHENAIWLRYYHIDTLHDFYQKFKGKFNKKQEKKLVGICLDVINWNEEDNIYYKENFLQIYSEIWWEKKVLTLWKKRHAKYPNFNYFKDVLDNENITKEEKDKMKFLIFITQEIVKSYQNKKIVLWVLNQVKEWLIEAVDTHEIKYPHISSISFSWVGDKQSELGRWGSEKYHFSYIFELIPKVDVLNDFLDLLDYSFSIQKKLISKELNWNYEFYCFYIRRIFYRYILNLDDSLVSKNYYYKIKDLLNKYDYKITYNFNLSDIKKKFWIDDIEEEAKEIIDNEGVDGVIKLLKERDEKLYDFLNIDNKKNIKTRRKKFVVFVEWPTDIEYIIKAWELLWKKDLLEMVELSIIWERNDKWETNKSNDDYLKHWGCFLSVNSDFIPYWVEKVLFLHDPENRVNEEIYNEKIYVRKMQLHENNWIKKWIEWLFDKKIIIKAKDKNSNLIKKTLIEDDGNEIEFYEIKQWYKSIIKDWICKNWIKDDFLHFNHIFDIISDMID